ncbi:MAG: hypothetical protein PVG50_07745 [Thiohalophilus sp.]
MAPLGSLAVMPQRAPTRFPAGYSLERYEEIACDMSYRPYYIGVHLDGPAQAADKTRKRRWTDTLVQQVHDWLDRYTAGT